MFINYVIPNIRKMNNIDPRVDGRCIKMSCPCKICVNYLEFISEEVKLHLFNNGIHEDHTNQNKHGEKDYPSRSSPKLIIVRNVCGDNPEFA